MSSTGAPIWLTPQSIAMYEVRAGLLRAPTTGIGKERFTKLLAEGFPPMYLGLPKDVGGGAAPTPGAADLPFTTDAGMQVDGGTQIHPY